MDALIVLSRDVAPDVRDWATFGLGSLVGVDSEDIRPALAQPAAGDLVFEAARELELDV